MTTAALAAQATTPPPPPRQPAQPTDSALGELSRNYDTFLTLLTTQLQNQDPLQPQDTSEFTNQLVQFSQVEQAINTNRKLDDLVAQFSLGQAQQALSYLGRTVELNTTAVPLQEGKAALAVTLQDSASTATLSFFDVEGRLVDQVPLPRQAGTHRIDWDGNADGKQLPDGAYGVRVEALQSDGRSVPSAVRVAGRVTAVDSVDNENYLILGELPIKVSDVLSVRD